VDTQTRHALKQDSFVQATTSGIGWLQEHRANVLKIVVPAAIAIVAVIAGIAVYSQRSAAADVALGKALTTYSSPLRQAGMPDDMAAASFATSADRAKAANQQFAAVAQQYGWLTSGKNALYFEGVTFQEMGQNGAAEAALKKTSGLSDKKLASLGKLALAGLYHQTGRDPEAIALYNQLISKPTDTVPAATAQLQLASIYETTRPDEAKRIYAELKDKDKTGAAGQIAAARLNPAAAAAQQPR
jgi:tetratricopeptide (TPR) repeat protein